MEINNSIMQYLWENYRIEYGEQILKEMTAADEGIKKEIYNDILLSDLFIIRIMKDPGFFSYLMDEMSKETNGYKDVQIYLDILYYNKVYHINEMVYPILKPKKEIDAELEEVTYNNALDYLEKCLIKAKSDKDVYRVRSIKHLIKVYKENTFYGCLLYETPDTPYRDVLPTHWNMVNIKFSLENIRYFEQYTQRANSNDEILYKLVYPSSEFSEFILNIVEKYFDAKYESFEEAYKGNSKFILDVFKLITFIWFNKKSLTEKIHILNREYKFKIREEDIVKLLEKFHDPEQIIDYGIFLIDNNYYVEASHVFGYIIDNITDLDDLFLCSCAYGRLFFETGQYEMAIFSYNKAMEYYNKKSTGINEDAVIASIFMSAALYKKGEIKEAIDSIIFIRKIIDDAPEKIKYNMYVELAKFYQLIHLYDEEYKCLQVCLKNDSSLRDDNIDYCFDRNFILEKHMWPNGIIKKYHLEYNEFYVIYHSFLNRFYKSIDSFQYSIGNNVILTLLSLILEKVVNNPTLFTYQDLFYDTCTTIFKYKLTLDEQMLRHLQTDDTHIDCSFYQGVYHCLRSDIETGSSMIRRAFMIYKRDCVSYEDRIYYLINTFLQYGKKEEIFHLIDQIYGDLSGIQDDKRFLDTSAMTFMSHGLADEGLKLYDLYHSKYEDNISKSKYYCNVGILHLNKNDFPKAINNFNAARLLNPNLIEAYYNLTMTYEQISDYVSAINVINEALKIFKDNQWLLSQKEKYENISKEVINIKSVIDSNAIISLKTADRIIYDIYNNMMLPDDFDFSTALVEYGKGLEVMINERFSKVIRKEILDKYDGRIPSDYYHGYKKEIPELPETLKKILGDNPKTISLGQWPYFRTNLSCNINNKVVEDVYNMVVDQYSDKLVIIEDACNRISWLRNPSSHYDVKTREEILQHRNDVVLHINKVIDKLYN